MVVHKDREHSCCVKSWSNRWLSIHGRVTLVKDILEATPVFWHWSLTYISIGIQKKIWKLCLNFLWSGLHTPTFNSYSMYLLVILTYLCGPLPDINKIIVSYLFYLEWQEGKGFSPIVKYVSHFKIQSFGGLRDQKISKSFNKHL